MQEQIEQVAVPATSNEGYPQQQEQVEGTLTEVGGVRLPRNFHAYGRNNHETWKPALTLEEPDDPSRVCHYAKQLVYPAGAGIEYSPEELLARKYTELLEQRKQVAQAQAPLQPLNVKVQEPAEHDQQLKKEPTYQAGQHQQQLYNSYQTETSYYMTEVDGELYAQNNDVPEEGNSDGDGEEEGEEPDQSDEESDGEGSERQDNGSEPVKQEYSNGVDGGMHFSAKTTYEQQNRSIRIKFKKERTLESSTYSAYTIESIYHQQQELPSPAPEPAAVPAPATAPIHKHIASPKIVQDWSGANAMPRQRNGSHHFHPYMLGQTSTPKSTANESRRARAKAKLGKFQRELCTNSNSSCSVPDQVANGVDAGPIHADSEAAAAPIHNATFNDNANFSFSSAGGHDNSNNSLALAVDGLHVRDASQLASVGNNKSQHANNNNNLTTQNATNTADFSTFQENSYFATQHDSEAQERRLSKALETIERHLEKASIDPFNSELCRAFLTKLNFPGDNDEHASYKVVQTLLPKISNTRTLNVLDSVQFNIDKEVGRGSYGAVYKATDTRTGNVVALKYQKPPNTWEIYICDQVNIALKQSIYFMLIRDFGVLCRCCDAYGIPKYCQD